MTVSTTTSRVSYSGNGSTVTFTVPFYFIYSTDLKVYKTSSANVQTLLVEGTDYTVTGAGVISGGSITCTTAPSSDYTIIIYRDPDTTQLVDYQANDPFPAETHERALDKLTMIAQRLNDVNDRSFHMSDGDTSGATLEIASPEANYLIGWNSTGDALQNVDPATLATVVSYATAYADTFTGDGTTTSWTLSRNPAVLYNLDVSINGVTQVPVTDYTLSGTTFTTTTAAPLNAVILVKYKEGLPNYSGDSQDIRYVSAATGAVTTTVQAKLRETISVKDFGAVGDGTTNDTTAILNAITYIGSIGGGTVYFPNGRYVIKGLIYNTNYISTPGVTLRGEKMPCLSSNADRLEHGAIICGRFNVFADDFSVENIGFDLGKYEMDTNYPGYDSLSPNLLGSTWDAFAFGQPNQASPLAARKNFRAQNVIGLLSRSASYGHAVLMEGFDGGFVDNVIGVYGIHGVVIKANNVRGGSIAGWMASGDNVIFKSDSYATGGNINIASVEARTIAPNCTPWSTPSVATYGLIINPATASFAGSIQIGNIKVLGSQSALYISGNASYTANDIQIGNLMADGYTGSMTRAVGYTSARAMRVQISNLIGNTMTVGVEWNAITLTDNADHQISIDSCKLTNITLWAVRAETYGRVRINHLEVNNAGVAYLCDDNARILIGKETLVNVTDKWGTAYGKVAPTLSTGWINLGSSYENFDVKLENFGCRLNGTLFNSGSATTSITTTQVYCVISLGSSTLAQWQARFSGLSSIPFVGQLITSTSTGTLSGGATVGLTGSAPSIFATLPVYLSPVKATLQNGSGISGLSGTFAAVPCVVNAGGLCATNEGFNTTGASSRLTIDGINWQNW